MSKTLVALTMVDSLLARAQELNTVIQNAQREGRDITEAELEAAAGRDDVAKATLEAAIAKAKAEGR
jgi:hypothetical protein